MYYLIAAGMDHIRMLRPLAALGISWVISLLLGSRFIIYFRKYRLGEEIRIDAPSSHMAKQGTPTMGGLFFILAGVISILICSAFLEPAVLVLLMSIALFSAIGFYDDYGKIRAGSEAGLSIRHKLLLQLAAAIAVMISIRYFMGSETTTLLLPLSPGRSVDLGWWFYPFGVLFITLFANSVNISDGLDGLAGGLVLLAALFLMLAAGRYYEISRIPYQKEISVVFGALAGALLGFLKFNRHPARVFMGDVGSQGLGASLATGAILLQSEMIISIACGIFLTEILSVIIQVFSFKCFGRRVFRMAPLHHHFELKGLTERSIVRRFWIAGIICTAAAVTLLYGGLAI